MERRALARLLGAGSAGDSAPRTFLAENDPARFAEAFAHAVAGRGEVFLCNPAWGPREWAQVEQLRAMPPRNDEGERGWLMIPTGGSSGAVKFARHDSHTIAAAVAGFAQHFGVPRVHALGTLPLHHVSGLMAWLRCVLTGGTHVSAVWKEIEAGARPEPPPQPEGWLTSVVPTQLERLLRDPAAVAWLRGFRVIFLGGAAASAELLARAAAARLPLAPSYGMTETAAMVTALRPEEFLAGVRGSGAALPHAQLELGAEGEVRIRSAANFLGYYPEWREAGAWFTTADAGTVDAAGHWRILGRRDAIIITGGEKVQPAEVEAVLHAATGATELAVVGVPDPEWGERVVAVFPAAQTPDLAAASAAHAQLSPPQRPKDYVALPEWPRNAVGKLNRARLAQLAAAMLRAGAGPSAG
jgi:O-succinylbenzoic acid--CoA ligase